MKHIAIYLLSVQCVSAYLFVIVKYIILIFLFTCNIHEPTGCGAVSKNFYYFPLFLLFSFILPYISCFIYYALIFTDSPPFDCKGKALEGWPCTAHQLLYLCGAWHIEGAQLSQLSEHVM